MCYSRDNADARREQSLYAAISTQAGIPWARESLLSSKYFKTYIDGELVGQQIEIAFPEFSGLRKEAEALWGTTDWKGDFVPGLLLKELPVVTIEAEGRL
jgi:hypothetical protein